VLDDLLEQKLVDDPDVVYHMAATVGVDEHAESACDAEVETNLNGASIVLHAAIRSGTPVLSRFDVRGLW
jgi:nucleoside-diphosphate-sugar epimerase